MNKILITTEFFGFGLEREKEYTEAFRAKGLEPTFKSLSEVWDSLSVFDGAIIGVEKADKDFFDQASNLKVAMKFGVGLDNFDIEYAKTKSIEVANLPGVNSDSVAEMVISLMLDVSRKVTETNNHYKTGLFKKELGNNIIGKTLGIIGTGNIGQTVMKMSSGFSLNYLGYDLYPSEKARSLGCMYVELDELLRESDFLTLHLPLSDKTRNFIGKEELAKMKKSSIVINTARGGIVDESALAEAVRTGQILGAGLDVFESHNPNPELIELDTVVCTPHISALTVETLRKMENLSIEKMSKLLRAI